MIIRPSKMSESPRTALSLFVWSISPICSHFFSQNKKKMTIRVSLLIGYKSL